MDVVSTYGGLSDEKVSQKECVSDRVIEENI